ncbi:bifunctional phosphoribosyl-AMP cyclohydrolase/phosphoribosyl-ATP diphosphatase HisIE [Bacillus sp. FJAT-42376]|uniref:bifunctional phosphoribosyl-AMP cyclohydrolase/phosphoribosyl-ATP diphosphatase HisIE n=1 Tax=Bacillus sp. FJAT-42376 TaxID=2014076 RepID=UPI000F4FF520|nr:bifunctional phosphoribosyl-AMP cyclohydrolase/phosphoribosyl-ATP diphosphatase HisIE [Bacillus sp. FJAT-42376]AZB44437.1 bifunctional phosphoribosyl-AMP cyclohydrolase/phosphoribosyl-ATP diphosphatase HisIE [Bacillus sp. FJAT-42376]
MNADEVRFDEKGLVPAIVQDAISKEVLTLAYMNKESLDKTIESGETWFFSRSRNELWHKGATSGNTQSVKELRFDCDQDAVLVLVEPNGPACHTGSYSCFEKGEAKASNNPYAILSELEQVIAKRDTERPEGSYTTYLLTEGVDKILKKVGEEASEVIIAAKNRSHDELKWEAADLIFHLLVLLREQKLPFSEVMKALEERK